MWGKSPSFIYLLRYIPIQCKQHAINYIIFLQTSKAHSESIPQENIMDNLSQQQYEAVLRYMEENHEDDFQQACKVMGENNYDIEMVRERRREREGRIPQYRELAQEEQDEEIIKMRKFLLKKSTDRRNNTKLKKCGDCLRNWCLRLTERFVPELIKRKVIRSNFCQIYQDQAVIQLLHRNLSQTLMQARMNSKKLFVIISEKGKNHCLEQFLKKRKLLLKIIQKQDYEVLGIIDTQFLAQYRQLYPQTPTRLYGSTLTSTTSNSVNSSNNLPTPSKKQVNPFLNINPPSILIIRQRHTEDLELVQHFYNESQILALNEQNLTQINEKIKVNMNKQSALLRRITERLFDESYNALQIEPQEQHNQVEQFVNNRRERKLIAQQNKQYLEMQRRKKEKQQFENRKKQQMQQYLEQRKCRKLSIPDEPQQNTDNVLKVIFRCPNGDNLNRKFDKKQKCQLLFTWVQLNDEIQFQGEEEKAEKQGKMISENERKFDLLFSYPPESLRQKMNMELGEIFQGEEQVKILIRQL